MECPVVDEAKGDGPFNTNPSRHGPRLGMPDVVGLACDRRSSKALRPRAEGECRPAPVLATWPGALRQAAVQALRWKSCVRSSGVRSARRRCSAIRANQAE